MNCPHGMNIYPDNHYGVTLYFHENGTKCPLLNSMDTTCEHLADTYISEFITAANIDDINSSSHLMRIAYSAYKVSISSRFHYIEFLSRQTPALFAKGFWPIYYSLISEDDYAINGLYLLELYYAFCGITKRITAVNPQVIESALYRFLSGLEIRTTIAENAMTRSYAHMLKTQYAYYSAIAAQSPAMTEWKSAHKAFKNLL